MDSSTKSYAIHPCAPDAPYRAMVLALGTTRVDETLDEVAAELRQRQIRGTVPRFAARQR